MREGILRLHHDQWREDPVYRCDKRFDATGIRAQRKADRRIYQEYNITMLVYYETASDIQVAIAREKQLKSWRRSKKIALIESSNPQWKDFSLEWSG